MEHFFSKIYFDEIDLALMFKLKRVSCYLALFVFYELSSETFGFKHSKSAMLKLHTSGYQKMMYETSQHHFQLNRSYRQCKPSYSIPSSYHTVHAVTLHISSRQRSK